ncbi:hypothetical protein CPB86DRAFT_699467 [Serendipita vermifera]|nr:hypothetical protein CPB86DRAFT_699467 [Serendipita vermifera]
MGLPSFKPNAMKDFIPKERFEDLEKLLISQIKSEASNSKLDIEDDLRFLEGFMNDMAQGALDQHMSATGFHGYQRSTNRLLSAAVQLLQKVIHQAPQQIRTTLLFDTIIACDGSPKSMVQEPLKDSITPSIATAMLTSMQSAIQSSFGARIAPIDTLNSLLRAVCVLSALLQSEIPVITEQCTSPNNRGVLEKLLQIYDMMLPSLSSSLPGSLITAEWGQKWIRLKMKILDCVHTILVFLSPKDILFDRFCEIDLYLLQHTRQPLENVTLLKDAPLMVDYQMIFKHSDAIKSMKKPDDARLDILLTTLLSYSDGINVDRQLILHGIGKEDVDRTPLAVAKELPSVDYKGKGRAAPEVEEDPLIETGISAVLDILPDQDPEFLRRCLRHKNFSGEDGPEKLIAALLEGDVPIDISTAELEDVSRPQPQASNELDFVNNRLNVFDDDPIDISTLHIGKKIGDADDLMRDKSWLNDMKAEILRRAEARSDEEDEYMATGGPGRRRFVPVDENDFDDFDESTGDVSVAGDGEISDGENDTEQKATAETILELAYIENPKLFDRDANTRRSKTRADLKLRTGLGDEQIEGWRIMLERNPHKDKILQKHEFKGNRREEPSDSEDESGEEEEENANTHGRGQSSRARSGGRGRGGGGRGGGGRGRGRGGGGQGEGSSNDVHRERAWKERNKGHDRRRGHDKKMARGAPRGD